MSLFKKRVNEFPTPYTCKNAIKEGGLETKLSMILMGLGNIVHGQVIKGLLYLAIEIAYIVFMVVNGIGFIGNLRTLGSVEQQEVWDQAKQILSLHKGRSVRSDFALWCDGNINYCFDVLCLERNFKECL